MQKAKTKLLTILLLAAITLAVVPFANASTGFITILTAPAIVPAGGDITTDYTGVLWSGGQFYLLLSSDGYSQVSPADIRFTPSMSVADLRAIETTTITDSTGTFPGTWTIGDNVINGSIPSNIAGGDYYIKAFDGAITSLAVTSSTFTVTGSLEIVPDTGAGGTSIQIVGNAFPAESLVNISYTNPDTMDIVTVVDLYPTGTIGEFSYSYTAPDLMRAVGAGDLAPVSTGIDFSAIVNPTGPTYTATYNENPRGLLQIGEPGSLLNATGLYGNQTIFVPEVSVGVGDSLRIVGNWFYPGSMSIAWDSMDVTPAGLAANDTGYFNTTITVPMTSIGSHDITLVDANSVVFVVSVNVVPSITLTPNSGSTGTTVTIDGYGFDAPSGTTVYNVTVTWDSPASTLTTALTNADGSFTSTFTVPGATNGPHTVTATSNGTAVATATFTIISNFYVTPSSFANNASQVVTATGTGFGYGEIGYWVSMDNVFSQFSYYPITADPTGEITFVFVGDGFRPGEHVVTLYEDGGNNIPVANATFTVTGDGDLATSMLDSLNQTTTEIGSDVTSIKDSIVTIVGDTAYIRTAVGNIPTSISSLQAQLSSIQGMIAELSTPDLGPITTTLSSIEAKLNSVSGDTVSIRSTVGTFSTSLSSINAAVTSLDGDVATVQTTLGTLTGTVTDVKDGVATIQTSIGTMQADISSLETTCSGVQTSISGVQTSVNGVQSGVTTVDSKIGVLQDDVTSTKNASESLSPLIIVAIVLALIAAIAAIASIILMRRKIAG